MSENTKPEQKVSADPNIPDEFFTTPPYPKKFIPLVVVGRDEWRALPPKSTVPQSHPIKFIVFTFNTAGRICYSRDDCVARMRQLQKYHQNDVGISDIAFNFMAGGDGCIYEGRGWNSRSSKYLKMDQIYGNRLDIGFIGNNIGMEFTPQKTVRPVYQLILQGVKEGLIDEKYDIYQARHKPPLQTYIYHELDEAPEYQRVPEFDTEKSDDTGPADDDYN